MKANLLLQVSVVLDGEGVFRHAYEFVRIHPGARRAAFVVFPIIAGIDMGMQERIEVAVDAVINACAVGCGHHRFAQDRHIEKVARTRVAREVGKVICLGIGEQEAVTGQKLPIGHHRESARHPADYGGILPGNKRIKSFGRRHVRFILTYNGRQ